MGDKTVAIVGAGFAGLATAKIFRDCGFAVTVFEKDEEVGGVWSRSRRYPGLCTQNNKGSYHLSDLEMPRAYPEWPSGHQVQAYLEQYVDHCGLRPLLRLGTEVKTAALTPSNAWQVESVAQPSGAPRTETFDYLVACNGVHSEPMIPDYPGRNIFEAAGGRVLHTSQMNDAALADGQRIAIVGYGKSSCDLAVTVLERAAAMHLVARTITWKMPRKLFGVLNLKYLLMNRYGESQCPYYKLSGVKKFIHGPAKPLRDAMMRSWEKTLVDQLGVRKLGLYPDKPLEVMANGGISIVSSGFMEAVAADKIKVHRPQIQRLDKGRAILEDGTELEIDLLICGTGWHHRLPFLAPDLMGKLLDEEGDFRLYRHQLPFGVPNLGLNGYASSLYCPLSAEIGALWLAEYFSGGIALPPEPQRMQEVDMRLSWARRTSQGKNDRGLNIATYTMHHVDDLLNDMNANLGALTRLKQWFVPISPSDYRGAIRSKVQAFNQDQNTHISSVRSSQPRDS
jgi:dimethylaniline monooxygenase (N-oxide forming)